jgi:predicted dehydrogenase
VKRERVDQDMGLGGLAGDRGSGRWTRVGMEAVRRADAPWNDKRPLVDYLTQPLSFKARKALRYTRLYGVSKTRAKIESQYHMRKRFRTLPSTAGSGMPGQHVGIVGAGKFAYSTIAYYLKRNYGRVIRGVMDVDINHAASLFGKYGLAYYTADADRVLGDPAIDLVYIASNHASHADYAIAALEAGKSVHIEKPHVVDEDQLQRLCGAMERSTGTVALGFNRPKSAIGREVQRQLALQSGPMMLSWFVAGHEIPPDHWYYAEEEGGRILGNLCHWTDFALQMVPTESRYPIEINPTRSDQPDCDIAVTYTFGDGSIAAITFSAKGHTFEGVTERLAAHRGNALIAMDNFKTLSVDVVERKHRIRHAHRDHGHERTICDSFELVRPSAAGSARGCAVSYVWDTGKLFLETKRALEANERVTVHAFDQLASRA